jgi:hypothetical protein
MKAIHRAVLGAAAVAALVLGVASPALADHSAGAELVDDTGNPYAGGDCYLGPLVSSIPTELVTSRYRTYEAGGRLHLVCVFTTPKAIDTDDPGYVDNGVGSWVAPKKLTVWKVTACLAPGSKANYDDDPQTTGTLAQKGTLLVMHCSWPLSDLR